LQFGDGLFETIAVTNNRPCLWDYHVQRLQSGCDRLRIAFPDARQLSLEAQQLIDKQQQAVLKITVTRGVSERGYKVPAESSPTRILSLFHWDGPTTDQLCIAVSRRRLGNNADLAGIKHLNRLEQVLARSECPEDAQEALMLDQRGYIIEGIMSNVFFQRGAQLFTPSLDRCGVAGIVRQLVLEVAEAEGVAVNIGDFTLDDVLQSDALYLTSSLGGIRCVADVMGYDWRPGTVFHPLLAKATKQVFSHA
jgi:4-amino-4-deoxychorismate lyase